MWEIHFCMIPFFVKLESVFKPLSKIFQIYEFQVLKKIHSAIRDHYFLKYLSLV